MVRDRRGGIVIGWLVRLVAGLLVLGLAAFEAGAVIVAKVNVDGTAQTAAREAALVYGTTKDPEAARARAESEAARAGSTLVAFSIAPDGRTITVTVRKQAATNIVQHIGPLKKFRTAEASNTVSVQ